jgi:octaprenyl-diphosphate synthase
MKRVDVVIRERLSSRVALVDQIGRYIVEAGGKRVRPRLLLLFAQALGYEGPDSHELAATVEFIHTATLLHDDVVDESSLRRGRATANALFGNAASVLVGDFLDVVADATNVIAEGEVLQLMNMHDPDLAVEDYLQVIRFKTAKLFEASARLGAILGQADAVTEEACADFGRRLGTAFQLVDDLLDYEGRSEELGKNVGDDIREGKATLPILLAMARGTAEEREMLRQAVQSGEVERLGQIIDVVRRTGAIEATRQAAEAEIMQARLNLDGLPPTPARDALLELCSRAVHRSF